MLMNEIKSKMEYIEDVTQCLGDRLKKEDYFIEDMGCPHQKPTNLPKGYCAVYIFVYGDENKYEFLKIGKVNSKSNARFTSQHYGFSAKSTLAKSLCSDNQFAELGVDKNNIKPWMHKNLRRINIYIKANKAITELVEAVFHYAFRPRYEGNI